MPVRPWLHLAALLLLPAAVPAQTTATWLGGTGNWTVAPLWSTNPLFPNNGNGGQTYFAVVNSGAVTVNQDITVTGLLNGAGSVTVGNGNTLTTLSSLAVTGGTLTTSGNGSVVSVGATNLTAGTIAPAAGGSVTLGGALTWTGGRLGGAGTTTLSGTGVASGTQGRVVGGLVTVSNGGSLAVTGGNLMTDAAVAGVTVNAGGLFDLRSDGVVLTNNFTGTLTNSGTLRRSVGTGVAQVDWVVNSTGAIDTQTGTLRFTSGGSLRGTHTGAGELELTGGTFTSAATPWVSSGTLVVSGATLQSTTGFITSTGTTSLTAGSLAPAAGGQVGLEGTFTWAGGSLGGAGTTRLTGAGTATGGGGRVVGGVVSVVGSGGSLAVTGGNLLANTTGAGVNVQSAGVFDLRSDGVVLANNAIGTLTNGNAGTLRRSGSAGVAQVDWVVNSSGAVDTQTGTLRFTNGGSLSGTHSGAGVLELNAGNFTTAGTFTSTGNIAITGAQLFTTGGSGVIVNTGTVSLSAGTLANAGSSVALNGSFTWTGGTLGSVVLNGTGVASGSGAKLVVAVPYIDIGGSLALTGGNLTANFTGAGVWVNGGLLDLRSDGVVLVNNYTGTLTMAGGTLRRSVGSGVAQVDWVLDNGGVIDTQTGVLRFTNGGTLGGTHTGAGILELTAGTFTTPLAGFASSGNLTVNSGTLTTSGLGAITSSGTVTLSAGQLMAAAGGSVTLGGAFTWTGGTLGGAGTTTLAGAGVASGTQGRVVGGVVTVANGGSLAVTGGNILANASGAGVNVQSGGLFDLRSDGVVLTNNFTGTITNSGTLRRSVSGGVAVVDWGVTNTASGLIDVQTGTLVLNGSLAPNAGTIRVASGATFQGNVTNNATGLLRGAGTVTGSMNLNAAGGTIEAGEGTADPNLTITYGLSMANDSKYRVQLYGTGVNDISRVNVTGGTTIINSGADLNLDLSGLNATQAQALRDVVGAGNSRDYTVLAATGTISGGGFTAGNFTITNLGSFTSSEWALVNGGNGGSNVVLRFTPVPEPAGLLAVAVVGLGGVAVARRLRRPARPPLA